MTMPVLPFDGGFALILCVLVGVLSGVILGAINGVLVAGFGMASLSPRWR